MCMMGFVFVYGFVDSIYDCWDLMFVGCWDDNEDIGNGKMFWDIEGNDIEVFFVKGSVCYYVGKFDGIFSGV